MCLYTIYVYCTYMMYTLHTYIHIYVYIHRHMFMHVCINVNVCILHYIYILYTYFVYNTHIYSYRVQNLNKLRLFFFSNSLSGKSAAILKNIFLVNRNSCLVWSPFEVSELFVMWSQYFSLQCMPES